MSRPARRPRPWSDAEREAVLQREAGRLWTLVELASEVGCTADSLRQRIHRGTLKATKAGRDWLVADEEARRVIEARRAEEEEIAKRAREIVAGGGRA